MFKLILLSLAISLSTAHANLSTLKAINNNTPAFALLVIKNGKTIIEDVKGCAEFKDNKCARKANKDTTFQIASLTKQFTAAAILMLEERELLSLNDSVKKYIPHLPKKFDRIKIKDLIFNVSGIKDYLNADILQRKPLHEAMLDIPLVDNKKALQKIQKYDLTPADFSYSYSNSNYILLAEIIKNVSGQKYETFIQKNIFNKLKMKHSFFVSNIKKHDNYAIPYSAWPFFQEYKSIDFFKDVGDMGIFTNLADYKKWIKAWDSETIFAKKETMKKFLSQATHDNGKIVQLGENVGFGYGFFHQTISRNKKKYNIISMTGSQRGFSSQFRKIIAKKTWIVTLSNAEDIYPADTEILKILKITW